MSDVLTQSPEQAIKQIGDELRASAKLTGSFLKHTNLRFGAWGITLAFGSAVEMGKLRQLENQQREKMKLPLLPPHYRPADTWHMTAEPIVPMQVISQKSYEELGMLAAAVGVPKDVFLKHPVETVGQSPETNKVHWQWRDEVRN